MQGRLRTPATQLQALGAGTAVGGNVFMFPLRGPEQPKALPTTHRVPRTKRRAGSRDLGGHGLRRCEPANPKVGFQHQSESSDLDAFVGITQSMSPPRDGPPPTDIGRSGHLSGSGSGALAGGAATELRSKS